MFATILRSLFTIASVPVCVYLMEGVRAYDPVQPILLGAVMAAVYLLLRPLMRLILSVFNFCTLGILNIVLDTWLLTTAATLLGNHVLFDSVWWALAVSLMITGSRLVVDILTGQTKK